ncbi:MAG: M48 family metallopeptidase [Candidatus Zixiibacteriota bacterium]
MKIRKNRFHFLIFIILLICLICYCATTGPGGKKSLILMSTSQEVSLGKEFAAQVDTTNPISDDSVIIAYVDEVGQKIAQISDRADLTYHFSVIDTPVVNAFACPGGFIYVYTGLLKTMDNEAQLAGVLAHEISHVVARHGVKRLQQILGLQVLLSIALGESSELTQQAVSTGVGVLIQGYSRDNEFESDEYGTLYMQKAGYNPEGMVQLLGKLMEMSQHEPGFLEEIMATHPPTKDRIQKVKSQIQGFDPSVGKYPFNEERYQKIKNLL